MLKIYLCGKCRTLLSYAGESPKSSLLLRQSACCTLDIVKESTALNGLSEKKSLKEIFTRLNFSQSIFEKEKVIGETPDISEYLDYGFYDWVYYWDQPKDIENPKIGRWLGVSHRIGSALCYFILKNTR